MLSMTCWLVPKLCMPLSSRPSRTVMTKSALLSVVPEEGNIIHQGGIFALVGPTGVGKTTTVAKLAAQATLKFGAEHVA